MAHAGEHTGASGLDCWAMAFPATRMRRLRKTGLLRDMVRETELTPSHLVLPMFVQLGDRQPHADRGDAGRGPAVDLPRGGGGRRRPTRSGCPRCCCSACPPTRTSAAPGAYDDEGVVQLAVRAIKEAHPELVVITDVCLCDYTSHGHCGVVRDDGAVDNDVTLELLAKTAISHAARRRRRRGARAT